MNSLFTQSLEAAKDVVELSKLLPAEKIEIQRHLNGVRSTLFQLNSDLAANVARVNVYADLCNKMLDRLFDRVKEL